jgi:ATP-dependent Clp protease protease subunit
MLLDGTSDDPVEVHLSSSDGWLVACLALADTIDLMTAPVHLVCRGTVGGAAIAVLVAAQHRTATSFASFHLIEPRVESTGTSAELLSFAEHHQRLIVAMHRRIADATGNGIEAVVEVLRPGTVFDADEALRWGLVDEVQRPGPAPVTPLRPR